MGRPPIQAAALDDSNDKIRAQHNGEAAQVELHCSKCVVNLSPLANMARSCSSWQRAVLEVQSAWADRLHISHWPVHPRDTAHRQHICLCCQSSPGLVRASDSLMVVIELCWYEELQLRLGQFPSNATQLLDAEASTPSPVTTWVTADRWLPVPIPEQNTSQLFTAVRNKVLEYTWGDAEWEPAVADKQNLELSVIGDRKQSSQSRVRTRVIDLN